MVIVQPAFLLRVSVAVVEQEDSVLPVVVPKPVQEHSALEGVAVLAAMETQ